MIRPDQSARDDSAHAILYANRWQELEPWVRINLNGDFSTERYQGMRSRHRDRLLLLHESLSIPMKIIRRHALDDPRLTEVEMRTRLKQYKDRQARFDSSKRGKRKP